MSGADEILAGYDGIQAAGTDLARDAQESSRRGS